MPVGSLYSPGASGSSASATSDEHGTAKDADEEDVADEDEEDAIGERLECDARFSLTLSRYGSCVYFFVRRRPTNGGCSADGERHRR